MLGLDLNDLLVSASTSFLSTIVEFIVDEELSQSSKFDGKSDEGFFVGYSMNSKAFRVYNIRTRKVEENLHIRFLEDKPIIAGDGPKWLFDIDVLTKSMNYVPVVAGTNSNDSVGTEESIGTGHSSKETGSSQDYILMPIWKDGSLFDSSLKNASNDEPQPSSDAEKKDDEGVCKESGIANQEKSENSTQGVNTAGPNPSTPNTRIHKDHSLDLVIGDVQSGVLTRRMTKTTHEQGFIRRAQKGNPSIKRSKLDRSYARRASVVQEQVWTLMDLLHGKRAIGTKWVYRNKKDERGIVFRNKARLVVQGYTQEKGMDYDEVFAPVARIEAIRVHLYGKIEEEVYVCQPPGFEDLEFPDRVYKVEKELYGLHQAPKACTPVETSKPLLKDAEVEDVDVHLYRSMIGSLMYLTSSRPDIMFAISYFDSDYAGASLDRKSTTGGCQFLKRRLISWQCKKQTIVANSTTKAEYVIAASYYGQECLTSEVLIEGRYVLTVNPPSILHALSNSCYAKAKTVQKGKCKYSPSRWERNQEGGKGFEMPTVPQHTPTINQPSSSQPPKKQKPRKTKKQNTDVSQPSDPTQPMADETKNVESVPIHSNDPLLSGEDRLKLNELLELCTKLSERVLDLD
ncbi:putative ribonuclease H-like domain-containing protein [Tanacetum coccineum]